MSIVSLNSVDEKNVSHAINNFISNFGIVSFFVEVRCCKTKGYAVSSSFYVHSDQ